MTYGRSFEQQMSDSAASMLRGLWELMLFSQACLLGGGGCRGAYTCLFGVRLSVRD